MYEPIRGGTRGGAGEFKWQDVSADKDREHYLGHSINAPTGRWQRNKDVHWYSRDKDQTAAEKAEELRKVKEAEAEALSVALGFKPMVRADPDAPAAPSEDPENKAAIDLQPTRDIQAVLAIEARNREKAERKAEKERRRAEKEQRRAAREERRRERDSYGHHGHTSHSQHGDRDRDYIRRERERSYSRSRSPPLKRPDNDGRGRYSRSLSSSRSPPPSRRERIDHAPVHRGRPMSRSLSPRRLDHPDSRAYARPPPRDLSPRRGDDYQRHGGRPPVPHGRGYNPPPRTRSPPRRFDRHSDRREAYAREISPPPPRRRFESPPRHSRSRSPQPIIRA